MDMLDHQNPPPPTPSSSLDPPLVPPGPSEAPLRRPSRPRILIIRGEDGPLSSLSPFQRREACDRMGKVTRCDRLRDGHLEVEFVRYEDAERALSMKTLTFTKREHGEKQAVTVNVSFSPHMSKNFSKGVIRCADLRYVPEEEIVDGLSEFGVVGAKKMKFRKGDELRETDVVTLTFDKTDLPDHVMVGYVRIGVRPFVPNPMRCFNCQRYGHTSTSCRGKKLCAWCGCEGHSKNDCTREQPYCVNCKEDHSVTDKECPAFKREKDILALMVSGKMTFREARASYEASHPRKSYSQVAATGTTSTSRAAPSAAPVMSRDEVIRSLSVADFVRLAGRMGLVFSNQPAAPVPEPEVVPPPQPPPEGGRGRDVSPASISPPPAPAGGGGRASLPAPERQPTSSAGDSRESAPGAAPSEGPTDSDGWQYVGRGANHPPREGVARFPPSYRPLAMLTQHRLISSQQHSPSHLPLQTQWPPCDETLKTLRGVGLP